MPKEFEPVEKKKSVFRELLPVLYIKHALRKFHISKEGYKDIEKSLTKNISVFSFIGSIAGILLAIVEFILIFASWSEEHVNVFTHIASYTVLATSFSAFIMFSVAYFIKRNPESRLVRIATTIFRAGIAISSVLYLIADMFNGDISNTFGISPAVLMGIALILCQAGNWIESMVSNVVYSLSLSAIAIWGAISYEVISLDQYIMWSVAYIIMSYVSYSAFTYVECQRHYIEFNNSDLLYKSTHDALTGVGNRAGLRLYLDDHLPRWKHNHEAVLLIMFDIDDFKLYNDEFGHLEGDKVLSTIAKTVNFFNTTHRVRVFRYGGEEFLLIVRNIDKEKAFEFMETIRNHIASLNIKAPKGMKTKYLTISLGGSLRSLNDDSYEFSKHIEEADIALYEAKNNGKNQSILRS